MAEFLRDRMELLADVLQRVEAEDLPFDMSMWVSIVRRPDGKLLSDQEIEEWDCGTAACAGGWLARDPRAHALGLALVAGWPCIRGSWENGISALGKFLGCSSYVAIELFDRHSYHKPDSTVRAQDVLERVRALLARGELT